MKLRLTKTPLAVREDWSFRTCDLRQLFFLVANFIFVWVSEDRRWPCVKVEASAHLIFVLSLIAKHSLLRFLHLEWFSFFFLVLGSWKWKAQRRRLGNSLNRVASARRLKRWDEAGWNWTTEEESSPCLGFGKKSYLKFLKISNLSLMLVLVGLRWDCPVARSTPRIGEWNFHLMGLRWDFLWCWSSGDLFCWDKMSFLQGRKWIAWYLSRSHGAVWRSWKWRALTSFGNRVSSRRARCPLIRLAGRSRGYVISP